MVDCVDGVVVIGVVVVVVVVVDKAVRCDMVAMV